MDNRIRFSAGPIDFAADVGLTGQDHDTYPAAGQQARYDWMRMVLIGLLSNQSSDSAPTQYRVGSLWFDTSELALKIRQQTVSGSVWANIAEVIKLDDDFNLADWYVLANQVLLDNAPVMTFSGNCNNNGVVLLPIPTSIQAAIVTGRTRPFVYINGLLIDPRNSYIDTTNVRLINGDNLNAGDRYTVEFKNISTFHQTDVDV